MKEIHYTTDELKNYLNGSVSQRQYKTITRHLEACEACNNKVEDLIQELVLLSPMDSTLNDSQKQKIRSAISKKRTHLFYLPRIAAILIGVLALTLTLTNKEKVYTVSTKFVNHLSNQQYIINIASTGDTTSKTDVSTYLVDTSYSIELSSNFDTLKNKLEQSLSQLKEHGKISIIINGAHDMSKGLDVAKMDQQSIFDLIHQTRLSNRPALLSAVDNTLEYMITENIEPQKMIIFSNNKAQVLAEEIQKKMSQQEFAKMELLFATL